MRKTGIATLISGLLLAIILFLVRQTDWFAAEQARGLSDLVELVESAFWAALCTAVLGVIFLLLSLRVTDQVPEEERPAPLERFWICPACGAQNQEAEIYCLVCGNPQNNVPVPAWTCPVCGADNPESVSVCQTCMTPRTPPEPTWICEVCGQENPDAEPFCLACQHRRPHSAPDWICPACGMSNDAGASFCSVCGTQRVGAPWVCSFCQRENPPTRTVCATCGKGREEQRNSWLCRACGTQNRISRSACIGCGQPRTVPAPSRESELYRKMEEL